VDTHNIESTYREKTQRYQALGQEIKEIWNADHVKIHPIHNRRHTENTLQTHQRAELTKRPHRENAALGNINGMQPLRKNTVLEYNKRPFDLINRSANGQPKPPTKH
jgi:hypothetical protein